MEEKELKTSLKQRIAIIVIAILMLGSIVASYVAIIINGGKTNTADNSDSKADTAKIAQYEKEYEAAIEEQTQISSKYFDKLLSYKNRVKAFNEAAANNAVLETTDLEVGSGREIGESDNDYVAYYIGWCADETVFDSSFDNFENPTKINGFFDVASITPIEGWIKGMEGAKLGGVRELTISSNLAYKEGEICDKTNQPIKFVVMPIARDGEIKEVAERVNLATQKLQYAYYGIDYEDVAGMEE